VHRHALDSRETIIETCRLSKSHVQLGVALPGNVYDEHGTMLLSKGQVLDSDAQLTALLERGMYVEIGVFNAQFRQASAAPEPRTVEHKFDPFLVRETMKPGLNRLLRGVIDASATPEQVLEFATHVRDFAEADPEAAIAACLLDRHEELRAVAHSLNSAILCTLLAKRLEWPDARQNSVICAALTMNLGMLDVQPRLSRQATPLTPVQHEQINAHPEAAMAALRQIAVADPAWLAAVHQHHEKPEGKGYPQQVPQPSEESQLIRLTDTFLARAASRADRPPLPPSQIIKHLFVEDGQGPFAALVASMVKLLGLYPPGCFVKLANGEIAVVFRNEASQKTPIVAAVTTTSGIPTMQPVRRDTEREQFAISGTVTPDKVSLGYDLGKLWVTNAKPGAKTNGNGEASQT